MRSKSLVHSTEESVGIDEFIKSTAPGKRGVNLTLKGSAVLLYRMMSCNDHQEENRHT